MRPAGGGTLARIDLHFDSGLAFFLSKQDRATVLTRILREKTSIKDAIEACGVPHPEVDLVQSNGATVPFEHQLQTDAVLEVYGVVASPATAEEHLQQRLVARFVVDGHLGSSRAICGSWASTSSIRRTRQMICSSRSPQLKIARW